MTIAGTRPDSRSVCSDNRSSLRGSECPGGLFVLKFCEVHSSAGRAGNALAILHLQARNESGASKPRFLWQPHVTKKQCNLPKQLSLNRIHCELRDFLLNPKKRPRSGFQGAVPRWTHSETSTPQISGKQVSADLFHFQDLRI